MDKLILDSLIKNVTLVTPEKLYENISIGIKQGLIASVNYSNGLDVRAKEVLDGTGLHALAGVIDSHVHCREPGATYKEDFKSFSRAALTGGITSIMDMPNSTPAVTSLDIFRAKRESARGNFFCDYAFYMGASDDNWQQLASWEREPGCAGTKLFMGSSTGDLLVEDDDTIAKIIAHGETILAVHAEDEQSLRERQSHRLRGQPQSHSFWRDEEVAAKACRRLMALAKEHKSNRPIHIMHVSTAGEMRILRQAQNAGVNVTMELTPHHLTLSDDDYGDLDGRAVVNPPLRGKSHREALWEAIQKKWITTIGSDHAPHSLEEKNKDYPDVPSGVPTAGLLLPLMLEHHAEGRLSLESIAALTAANPAKRYGLSGKGEIKEWYDADIVLVDMKKSHRIDSNNSFIRSFLGKSQWSPYEDRVLRGWPRMVFLRGRKVIEDGVYLCEDKTYGAPLCFEEG